MIDKIIYIIKSEMHIYPPCIAQIRMIKDLGIDVEVWYGSCNHNTVKLLSEEGIFCTDLKEKRGKYKGKLDVIYNWLDFGRKVKKNMNLYDKDRTLFWFGTTESAIPLLGKLRGIKYALTSLELLDDNLIKKTLFGVLAKKTSFIVCCETTRAFIMRYWYKLKKLPYVMPNKPYKFDSQNRKLPTIAETEIQINRIKDKKFVIYQGILKSKDYMIEMARALRESNKGYYFVLMGLDPENIYPEIAKEYKKTLFIENIPSPYHLEITSYAHIGFVFYDDRNTLNRAFCAPNKIYEYSGLGIPAIGNKVPGLINTIGAAGAGICTEMNKNSLCAAINKIDSNYAEYKNNSTKFYKDTDNFLLMKQILSENNIIKK